MTAECYKVPNNPLITHVNADLSDAKLDEIIAVRTSDLKEATDEKRRRLEGKIILCACACGCRADCAPFLIPCCSACGIGVHTSIHVVENPDANT